MKRMGRGSFHQGGVQGTPETYLYEKTVTWGDASTTEVKIDNDGFFHLGGDKKKLLCMDLGLNGFVADYLDDDIIAILNLELAYLYSVGIRIVSGAMNYNSTPDHISAYHHVLDTVFQNKMLFIPTLTHKYDANFDPPNADYQVDATPVILKAACITAEVTEVVKIDATRTDLCIVTYGMDNEVDQPYGTHYTAGEAAAYMSEYRTLVKALTTVPVITKFMAYWGVPEYNTLRAALAPYSQIPCYDLFASSPANFTTGCNSIKAECGKSNFWITEMNNPTGSAPRQLSLTADDITAVFNAGAALICLIPGNRNHAGQEPLECFFDEDGAIKAHFDDDIAPSIAGWQVAI